jgi:FAD synthetase
MGAPQAGQVLGSEGILKANLVKSMRKVLVGGAFNIVHPGHIMFLSSAKRLGDYLVVVVASDSTVRRNKGYLAMKAEHRRKVVESLRMVDKAVIGHESDLLQVVRKERPDIIALGYDQTGQKQLALSLEKLGIRCRIVRIRQRLAGVKTAKIIKSLKSRGCKEPKRA